MRIERGLRGLAIPYLPCIYAMIFHTTQKFALLPMYVVLLVQLHIFAREHIRKSILFDPKISDESVLIPLILQIEERVEAVLSTITTKIKY